MELQEIPEPDQETHYSVATFSSFAQYFSEKDTL